MVRVLAKDPERDFRKTERDLQKTQTRTRTGPASSMMGTNVAHILANIFLAELGQLLLENVKQKEKKVGLFRPNPDFVLLNLEFALCEHTSLQKQLFFKVLITTQDQRAFKKKGLFGNYIKGTLKID